MKLHIVIYLAVNIIWLALNMMGTIKIEPYWAVYCSPVGWGILIIVHYTTGSMCVVPRSYACSERMWWKLKCGIFF